MVISLVILFSNVTAPQGPGFVRQLPSVKVNVGPSVVSIIMSSMCRADPEGGEEPGKSQVAFGFLNS